MVSRAADYALRATLALAGRPQGIRMSLGELAEETDVPFAFLYKVLRTLVQKGLLVAHRGKSGGYELAALARRRTVLDVVDALDGLPVLNACLSSGGCHRSVSCPAHPIWSLAQQRMREVLAGATLNDLVRGTAPDLPVPTGPAGRAGHRLVPVSEIRERLPRAGARVCVRLRRDERLPAQPRGRDLPVLAGPRGDGRQRGARRS
jgi:Rrf2 family protein